MFVSVPCGECLDCIQQSRNDWFVRLYYEWKSFYKDGIVLFPTLSYNDDCIPHTDFSSSVFDCLDSLVPSEVSRPRISVVSFDKETVIKAIRKFRTQLSRDFANIVIKYFLVCEYGDTTHRPHYHLILFLSLKLDTIYVRNQLEKAWSYVDKSVEIPKHVQDFAHSYFKSHPDESIVCPRSKKDLGMYKYVITRNKYGKITYQLKRGNVEFSKEFGAIIESSDSLNYVTKYLHKLHSIEAVPNMKSIYEYSKYLPTPHSESIVGYSDEIRSAINSLYNVFPFHLISNKLGISLFDDLELRSSVKLTYDEVMKSNLLPNHILIEQDYYAIPTYITRKLFYSEEQKLRYDTCTFPDGSSQIVDCKNTKRLLLNSLGREVMSMRFELKVKNMAQKYRSFNSPGYLRLFDGLDFTEETALLYKEISHYDTEHLDFELLAIYKIMYQNLDLSEVQSYDHVFLDPELCKRFSLAFTNFKLDTYNDLTEFFESPLKDDRYVSSLFDVGFCNSLPIFEGFDSYLVKMDTIKSFVKKMRCISQKNRDILKDRLNNFFNSLIYV